MPLTQDQQQRFQNWISNKNRNFSCPCCNQQNFSLGDIFVGNTVDNGGVAIGQGIPMVPVICNNCSYVNLFATGPIGV